MSTQLYRWCFTVSRSLYVDPEVLANQEHLKKVLGKVAKKWCFQLEEGEETGLPHFQGRVSLHKKVRLADVIKLILPEWKIHWEGERDEAASEFYVQKSETRIAGPWSDKDKPIYIPRQLRGLTLKGWQLELQGKCREFDSRSIYFVIDPVGGIGKSTFTMYMGIHHGAIDVPPTCSTSDDMCQFVCGALGDRKEDIIIMLDVPRSITEKSWPKWISALETMKKGYMYDHRYRATVNRVDSPVVIVFSNELPPASALTGSRWIIMRPKSYDDEVVSEIQYGREQEENA